MEIKFKLSNLKQHKEIKFKKDKLYINPDQYWLFVLSLNFLVFIGFGIFGYLLFLRINSESPVDIEVTNQIGINEKELREALLLFENRAQKSENIKAVEAPMVDPSR